MEEGKEDEEEEEDEDVEAGKELEKAEGGKWGNCEEKPAPASGIGA